MKVNENSKQIAKAATIVFFGMVIGRALTYLYVALVARLGASNYGLFSLGSAIVLFVSTLSLLGLKTGIVRYVSFYNGKKDNSRIKGTIFSSIKISLPISIVLTLILFVFAEQISTTIFHNPSLTPVLRIFSLMIPFLSFSNIFLNVLNGFKKIKHQVFISEVIENVVRLGLTFFLLYLGFDILGAIIGYVASVIITALICFYVVQKKVFSFINKNKSVDIGKEILMYSIPLFFVEIFTLIIKWSDVLMIGYFKTANDVGIYNAALPTANLLVLVPTALIALFMPMITELYSNNKVKDINNISKITSKWIFFVNIPIFFLLIILAQQILSLLFGPTYALAASSLMVLSFGYIIHSLTHVHTAILSMLKKTKTNFYIMLGAIILNLILNYTLIPRIGILGGAIGTSVALITIYLSSAILNYKATKMQFLDFEYVKAFFAGIISFIIIIAITKIFIVDSIIKIILIGIIFSCIYLALLFLLKAISKEDKNLFLYFYNKFVKQKNTKLIR